LNYLKYIFLIILYNFELFKIYFFDNINLFFKIYYIILNYLKYIFLIILYNIELLKIYFNIELFKYIFLIILIYFLIVNKVLLYNIEQLKIYFFDNINFNCDFIIKIKKLINLYLKYINIIYTYITTK